MGIDSSNAPVCSFAALSFLLLLGKAIRMVCKPVRDLYLPSSVVGGLLGYGILQLLNFFGEKGCVVDDPDNNFEIKWDPNYKINDNGGKGKYLPVMDKDKRHFCGIPDDSLFDSQNPDFRVKSAIIDNNVTVQGPSRSIAKSYVTTYFTMGWGMLPEVLIGVIFAAVFIGVKMPPCKAIWEGSGPQLMYGQIVTHGLWGIGLLAGWICGAIYLLARDNEWSPKEFWLQPEDPNHKGEVPFGIPKCYGVTMYLGFEGGHGTVAGLKKELGLLQNGGQGDTVPGWKAGPDVALGMATTGLLGATIWGVLLINIASRRGWLALDPKKNKTSETNPDDDAMLMVGIYSPETRQPMGYETTVPDSIDTLSLHMALVGIACFIAWCILKTINILEGFTRDENTKSAALGESIPLFPLCMIGGMIVDKLLRCVNLAVLIDHSCMQRVSGLALDFLVTAVLATMRLETIVEWPFAGLTFIWLNVVGFAWHFFCILFLAPRMLPDCWFERAIFEVGHSMGTTANGLILLKMVDPQSQTAAPSAIAYKLVLHEPMMGFWVAGVVWALKSANAPNSPNGAGGDAEVLGWAGASFVMLILWFSLYFLYFKKKYAQQVKDRSHFLEEHVTADGVAVTNENGSSLKKDGSSGGHGGSSGLRAHGSTGSLTNYNNSNNMDTVNSNNNYSLMSSRRSGSRGSNTHSEDNHCQNQISITVQGQPISGMTNNMSNLQSPSHGRTSEVGMVATKLVDDLNHSNTLGQKECGGSGLSRRQSRMSQGESLDGHDRDEHEQVSTDLGHLMALSSHLLRSNKHNKNAAAGPGPQPTAPVNHGAITNPIQPAKTGLSDSLFSANQDVNGNIVSVSGSLQSQQNQQVHPTNLSATLASLNNNNYGSFENNTTVTVTGERLSFDDANMSVIPE